ncbi:MAG: gamma-glutamyl-gamma-aminobutyrate hydrolase family protein [Chloroflexi bacterium]|nr:gamma-glutamyl-gamma-aminobutyrate hydrolase family protein [Chloroflexota bacterium]
MSGPRIGITTGLDGERQTLDLRYAQAVEAAGGIPIIVPLIEQEDTARAIAAVLDGLIITGGPGITRGLIGALPEDLPAVDERRDRSDELIYRAMADRPFLGICYGMQFANALAGGRIYGDAQVEAGTDVHSAERGGRAHPIAIGPGSQLRRIMGMKRMMTNTHHIQAIADLGAGLQISARAADGVIEAIESADGRIIAVQFHPERMMERALPIFEDLVRRASKAKSS